MRRRKRRLLLFWCLVWLLFGLVRASGARARTRVEQDEQDASAGAKKRPANGDAIECCKKPTILIPSANSSEDAPKTREGAIKSGARPVGARARRSSQSANSTQVATVSVVAGLHLRAAIPCGPPLDSDQAPESADLHSKLQQQARRGFAQAPARQPLGRGRQAVSLLAWHKDNQLDTPIFVADARNAPALRDSRQVINADALRGRASLEETLRQPALVIEQPEPADAGLYTCTMEFVAAPTRTHQVRLQVIKPPQNMLISASSGDETPPSPSQQHSQPSSLVLGPFDEGSQLNVACVVDSGSPDAGQVSWWRPIDFAEHSPPSKTPSSAPAEQFMTTRSRDGVHAFLAFHKSAEQSSQARVSLPYPTKLWARVATTPTHREHPALESPSQMLQQETEGQLRAVLAIKPLKRAHLEQEFLCLALNNKHSAPLNKTVKLNLNLKPTQVKIINKASYTFQPGLKTALECQVRGSKPAPRVRWLLGDQELSSQLNGSSASETIRDMSQSEAEPFSWASHLTLVAELRHHQQPLTCEAQNPELPAHTALSDTLVMDVQYAPQLTLAFGASIKPDSMRLGADVFMDCSISANPPPALSELVWLHNGQPLAANVSAGVIMSNQTLVLQRIRLEQRGVYQCASQNSIGRGASNKLDMRPKFEPQCDYSRTQRRHEVSLNHPTRIDCFVLAEPANDLQFEWKFNKSLGGAGASSWPPSAAHSAPSNPAAGSRLPGSAASSDDEPGFVSEPVPKYETNFTQSYIMFRAESARHSFGELQCRASNSLGLQAEPCRIQVIPFELPEPVDGCFTDRLTANSFSIHCQPSAPPTSAQAPNKVTYLLELYEEKQSGADDDQDQDEEQTARLQPPAATKTTHMKQQRDQAPEPDDQDQASQLAAGKDFGASGAGRRVKHIVNDTPTFHLNGLSADTGYQVLVYAQNAKARSNAWSLPARTLRGGDEATSRLKATGSDSIIEFVNGNNRRQPLATSESTSTGDKLKSYFKLANYATLSGHSKQVIEVALIVLLCAISLALVSFLLSTICKSGSRTRPSDSRAQSRDKPKRPGVRIRVAPNEPGAKLELFDSKRPQLDSSMQLMPAPGDESVRQLRGLAGTGSDSSRETNTESTLVTSSSLLASKTTSNSATRDSCPANRAPVYGSLRQRQGSREQECESPASNMARCLHFDRTGSLQFNRNQTNRRGSVDRFADHQQQFQLQQRAAFFPQAHESGKMLLLGANSLLSGSNSDTPQCSLRSGHAGSDCMSSPHEQPDLAASGGPLGFVASEWPGVVPLGEQAAGGVYIVHNQQQPAQDLYCDGRLCSSRASFLASQCLGGGARPASHSNSCRLFSHDDLPSMMQQQQPLACGQTAHGSPFAGALPSSASIPVSLSSYQQARGDMLISPANVHSVARAARNCPRQEAISQLMQNVICGGDDASAAFDKTLTRANNNQNNLGATDDSISLSIVTPSITDLHQQSFDLAPSGNQQARFGAFWQPPDDASPLGCDPHEEQEAQMLGGGGDWRPVNELSPVPLQQQHFASEISQQPAATDRCQQAAGASSQKPVEALYARTKKGHVKFED